MKGTSLVGLELGAVAGVVRVSVNLKMPQKRLFRPSLRTRWNLDRARGRTWIRTNTSMISTGTVIKGKRKCYRPRLCPHRYRITTRTRTYRARPRPLLSTRPRRT
jgi:hypothetical protein